MSHEQLIDEAKSFWAKIAEKNGWSMDGRRVQVWVDDEGFRVDSVYLPENATHDLICDTKSNVIAEYSPMPVN